MNPKNRYGLEQARAHLPLIAAEAEAGYSTEITRHGKPVAVVVPAGQWKEHQAQLRRGAGLLALRGSGRGLWQQGACHEVENLRSEWDR